jgi:hypothetical protein
MYKAMCGRRGFVKILEMFLAVTIVFIFLMLAIPRGTRLYSEEPDLSVLYGLSKDSGFRNAVLSGNNSYINASIRNALDANSLSRLNFTFSVSSNPNFVAASPQDEMTISYSMLISSEHSNYGPKILRIYAWKK